MSESVVRWMPTSRYPILYVLLCFIFSLVSYGYRAAGRAALVVAPVQPRRAQGRKGRLCLDEKHRRRASGRIEHNVPGAARLVHDGVPHVDAVGPDPASKHAALSPAISRLSFPSVFFEFVVVVPYHWRRRRCLSSRHSLPFRPCATN